MGAIVGDHRHAKTGKVYSYQLEFTDHGTNVQGAAHVLLAGGRKQALRAIVDYDSSKTNAATAIVDEIKRLIDTTDLASPMGGN